MHGRASLRNDQVPYLRTSAYVDAWVVRCKGRNRPRDDGLQPQAHHKCARRNQANGISSSGLIERSDRTRNPKSWGASEKSVCVLLASPPPSFVATSVSCPATPGPEVPKQFGSGTKFLLRSSAPASGGFMAEPVGTCQCSPLTLR